MQRTLRFVVAILPGRLLYTLFVAYYLRRNWLCVYMLTQSRFFIGRWLQRA